MEQPWSFFIDINLIVEWFQVCSDKELQWWPCLETLTSNDGIPVGGGGGGGGGNIFSLSRQPLN